MPIPAATGTAHALAPHAPHEAPAVDALVAVHRARCLHAAAVLRRLAKTADARACRTTALTRTALEGITGCLKEAARDLTEAAHANRVLLEPAAHRGLPPHDAMRAARVADHITDAYDPSRITDILGYLPDASRRIAHLFTILVPGTRVTDGRRTGTVTGGLTLHCGQCSTGRYRAHPHRADLYVCTDCPHTVHAKEFDLQDEETLRTYGCYLHATAAAPTELLVLWDGAHDACDHTSLPVRPIAWHPCPAHTCLS